MNTEPSRQIHLDFHTSEHIPDIGARFSRKQFQEALVAGHVNQINVFAKCHHSWSYYPTTVGKPHPNLAIDLLGEQIAACHEIGIVAPVYYTGGWSAHDAEEHPEWCMRTIDGAFIASEWPADAQPGSPKPLFQWKELCVSGAYHDLMVAQTDEICRLYDVDGMFYDIYHADRLCYCEGCRAQMSEQNVDINDVNAVEAFRAQTIRVHAEALTRVIQSHHPEASIYFNGLTMIDRPQNFRYRLHDVNTKNDLEDLPTTWGGYDKFPYRSRIFHRTGKPVVAMSGKFHTAWGEFGGFKNPEALRYEAAAMIAYGASCNFGDHLHPLGEMDATTYRNIGHAFAYVEQIEQYGLPSKPVASLGLWASYDSQADEGVTRMLLEEQLDFDVVGEGDDLSRYRTIVVPSVAGLIDASRRAFDRFLDAGGALVILGAGALRADRCDVALPCGARFTGEPQTDVDYTHIAPSFHDDRSAALHRRSDLPETPFLNYEAALRFELTTGPDAQALAWTQLPYFSRTYGEYCGHQNTPNIPQDTASPAVWRSGRIVVLAHALDRIYRANGAKVHRDVFARALRLVHAEPMVEADLPSAARVTLLHQPDEHRYVAHLLYGPPIARGRCLVIEDLPELSDVRVRIRVPERVASLTLVPDGTPLDLRTDSSGYVETTVPRFRAHCAVAARY